MGHLIIAGRRRESDRLLAIVLGLANGNIRLSWVSNLHSPDERQFVARLQQLDGSNNPALTAPNGGLRGLLRLRVHA